MATKSENRADSNVVDRDKWVKRTLDAILSKVEEYKSKDLHSCIITTVLYVGAENLFEAAESLGLVEKGLRENGFIHKIDPNGNLVIEW